jgi:hypothetical protein
MFFQELTAYLCGNFLTRVLEKIYITREVALLSFTSVGVVSSMMSSFTPPATNPPLPQVFKKRSLFEVFVLQSYRYREE